jgi:hypothetical protein
MVVMPMGVSVTRIETASSQHRGVTAPQFSFSRRPALPMVRAARRTSGEHRDHDHEECGGSDDQCCPWHVTPPGLLRCYRIPAARSSSRSD